jgi:hypothetical protein
VKKSLSSKTLSTRGTRNRENVQAMAVEILTFLSEEPERLVRFFDLSGVSVETLRQVADTAGFRASLFDFIGSDEAMLLAFAARFDHDPAEVDRVRLSLSPPVFDS